MKDSPTPADDIDEPAAEGTADAAAEGGDQVDIGTPLGHVPDGEKICVVC